MKSIVRPEFTLLFLLFLLPRPGIAEDRYVARFDRNLDGVEVEACFTEQAPRRLYRHSSSSRFVSWIRSDGEPLGVTPERGAIRLPKLQPGACIEWRIDLASAAATMDEGIGFSIDGDLLVDARTWFWRGGRDRDVLVRVEIPEGMAFSTPWPRAKGQSGGRWYRPDKTSPSWRSRIAIGRFAIDSIEIPGASIRLAAVGDLTPGQKKRIRTWVEQSARAVSTVHGRFPQPHPQVLVVPIGKRNEPVPWAHVIRGGGVAVELFIDETRSLEEFTSDWTAMHEFSHLLLPHVSSRDRWLSEGLASYYQNVLRARSGVLTSQQAWQLLYDGFMRGINGASGDTLAEAARSRRGSTMQIYWSGAAMMLMADAELRAETGGAHSLDSALGQLSECCMANGRSWRARDLLGELDRLTGTGTFSALYREHVYADDFPDFSGTWEELGLETRRERVTVKRGAPLAAVREAIMDG